MANKKEFRKCVYIGTVNGKEVTKTVRAATKRELESKVLKLKSEISKGKDVYTRALFGAWADKWLKEVVIPKGISKGTITQYESAIKHLKRSFEDVEIKDITLSDFNQFKNELAAENPNTGKPMAKHTLETVVNVAHNIFCYAIANNISGVTDYFKSVTIPKTAPKKERRALTEQEQQWVIETQHRAQLPAMIMLFAGLRRGEVIPLMWSDIDLQRGLIYVNKSVEYDVNQPKIKPGGKTASANRVVPIPPILIDYLKEYKANTKVLSMYLCLNEKGQLQTKSSWDKMWKNYLNTLNMKYGYDERVLKERDKRKTLPMRIEQFTPHYLRHTFATMLYLEDVDVVTAKQLLGHANIQITIDIYTDLKSFNKATLTDDYKVKLQTEYKVCV